MASRTDDGKQRGFCSCGRAWVIAAAFMFLLLAVGIISIDDTCDDIAIIGAGISGTYAAWRLRERGLSISVYEYSDRIGGRLHTVHFPGIPDINVELGGMRFIPSANPKMSRIAKALKLSIVDSAMEMGLGDNDLFYLRGVHMRRRDLGNDNNPYNLKLSEQHLKHHPSRLKREYFINHTSYNPADELNATARFYSQTTDGVPLYIQSADVAYSRMGVSREAAAYFLDTSGFRTLSSHVSSSLVVPVELLYDDVISALPVKALKEGIRVITTDDDISAIPVKTIGEGMQAVPESLAKEYLDANSHSHTLLYNHELWKIEKQPDLTYKLKFWPTETVVGLTHRKEDQAEITKCAKKVILSIPRLALESIDWEGFRNPEVKKIIKHSLKDVPVAKIYLAYDRPWWRELPFTFSHSISDLPNRQTYDCGTSGTSNKAVLLAGYTDMEDVKFWREVQSRDSCTGSPSGQTNIFSDAGLSHVTNFVAELFNISVPAIPKPLGGAISLWDEFPYGGGWHVWMPGFEWTKVEKKMTKPSDDDEIYISCNAFSPGLGSTWAEFALEQTDMVIDKIGPFT